MVNLSVLGHDMIISRDLMVFLGMIIDFKDKALHWDYVTIQKNRTNLYNENKFN